ncbi:MAG: sulfatase-like hydrolase/transferase, partial [Planctomycetota bacterium]
MPFYRPVRVLFGFAAALCLLGPAGLNAAPARPNIVLIMADDMGYSDIGCYGSEIETPALDRLAAGGVRMTQFYNTGRCCPTRASLLTGLHPHQTGLGHMTGTDRGTPAYQGYLNRKCVTIAEVLKSAGYQTFMSGKWHVGQNDSAWWPRQRGFDRYYGILAGAANYFRPSGQRGLTLDNESVDPGDDYYMTDAFGDYATRFVDEAATKQAPFFLYLAFNAPHWPLHAPKELVAKYRGKYRVGWDKLATERHARQVESGLIDPSWE